jgi:predicted HTH transcriptional regulator
MKGAKDWDEAYLLELIRVGEQESLTLDYKGSPGLAKTDKCRSDLSKDVSSLANSAGGFLVYGMLENKHVPTSIDIGVDRNVITKEWLESVIKSVIQPVVDDLVIKQIELPSKGTNKVAYVVQIAQAASRAPYQANDYRYYKRFNFESTPMEDYEVRDLMRRSIEYGKKYGAAWDFNVEIQRMLAAINERGQMNNSDYMPRDRLIIRVSNALRSAGNVIVLLEKPVREMVATLVIKVDEFNSEIELTDPGRREEARLNERMKGELAEMFTLGGKISGALREILKREP